MKESFANIVAWAKKNPALAVLIVGAVVLLAYLVYKRGGGSSGGAPGTGLGQASPIDTSGLVSSGGGGGGETPPGKTPPTKKKQPKKNPTPTPIPIFGDGSSGWQMLPGVGGGLQMTPVGTGFSPFPLPINESFLMGQKTVRQATPPAGQNYSSGPGGKSHSRWSDQNQTDAMAVGKGRHFTGYYNGVYYSNGQAGGSLNIPGVSQSGDYYYSDTGDRPAVASGKVRY